ncbi:unnamed protein product, partial [Vitis vinifera]
MDSWSEFEEFHIMKFSVLNPFTTSTYHYRRFCLWAVRDNSGHLSPFNFSIRSTGEEDVRFKVLYSGLCHSDLHHLPSCARV